MKARLTVYTADKKSLFFNTVCELETAPNRAQIRWEGRGDSENEKIILGINRKKITLMRYIDDPDMPGEDGKSEEEFFVLSTEKNEPSKAVIAFDGIEMYFSTEYFMTRIGKDSVDAELVCMVHLEDRTDRHKIYIKCVSVNSEEKTNSRRIVSVDD